jgi:hypothetical protein
MINFKDFVFGQIDEVVEPVTQSQQKKPKGKALYDRMLEVGMKLATEYNKNPTRFKSHKAAQRIACLLGRCGVDTATGIGHITNQLHMITHEGPNAFNFRRSEVIGARTEPKIATNADYLAKDSHTRAKSLASQGRRTRRAKKLRQETKKSGRMSF